MREAGLPPGLDLPVLSGDDSGGIEANEGPVLSVLSLAQAEAA
jgi:hypothetical protein